MNGKTSAREYPGDLTINDDLYNGDNVHVYCDNVHVAIATTEDNSIYRNSTELDDKDDERTIVFLNADDALALAARLVDYARYIYEQSE